MLDATPLLFWAIVYAIMWALKRRPDSAISRAAFTWFGPRPRPGEPRSTLELRWVVYAFGWLCQFALGLSALLFVASRVPPLREETWFQLACFCIAMGIMLALLATVGFVARFLKARFLGPVAPPS